MSVLGTAACLVQQRLVNATGAEGLASQQPDQGPEGFKGRPPAPGHCLLWQPACKHARNFLWCLASSIRQSATYCRERALHKVHF